MRSSISTLCMGGLLPEKLVAIAEAGFEGIELADADVISYPGSPEAIAELAVAAGLQIVSLIAIRDFEGMPEPYRERAFGRARAMIELATRLGTPRLAIMANVSPQAVGGIERIAEDLWELGALAERAGISIGYEALGWSTHVRDYRDAWEIVRRTDHPRIGLVLDNFHIQAQGLPMDAITRIPSSRIILAHISDAPRVQMETRQLSRQFRCFPGGGELDVVGFLEALGATGYDGWVSQDTCSDRMRLFPPRQVAEDAARSMVYLTNYTKEGTALPRAPITEGLAFVEFAANEAGAERLGTLFRQLGFRLSGQHVSKHVQRFSQGEIDLVVNAEPSGFAHKHFLTNGSSVAAMGLWVDDAPRGMERARALRVKTYRGPVSTGELDFPAILGVGGSLVYLLDQNSQLDRIWDMDFETVDAEGEHDDAGLAAIDHVAMTIPFEDLESWRLFFSAVLGFARTPQCNMANPMGLAESQIMFAPNQSVKFVLNSSEARQSRSSQFTGDYFDPGVQHIAFSTGDIFKTVKAMRARGAESLPIPDNYYEVIAARHGLLRHETAALNEHGVLYDEDDNGGRYWHFYTPVIEGHYFFEIVQRDGYTRFGAINSAIRFAAQTFLTRASLMPAL